MNDKKATRETKGIHAIAAGLLAAAVLAVIITAAMYHHRHTFSTAKWLNYPEERTAIVNDLLEKYELVGMTEADVAALLGEPNNDYGYFNADNRYVYYMGPERGLISIDSEWLLLDFTDGRVSGAYIKTD